jgi:hypothetical protein
MLHTINNVVNLTDTESQILKCKEIKHKIDVLQAEYDKVKKSLTEGYFSYNDEFVGSEGLVLATYKSQDRSQFMGSELKKDKPELYAEYSAMTTIKVFLLKK